MKNTHVEANPVVMLGWTKLSWTTRDGDASHHPTDTCGPWPGHSHLCAMETVPTEITSPVCGERGQREK